MTLRSICNVVAHWLAGPEPAQVYGGPHDGDEWAQGYNGAVVEYLNGHRYQCCKVGGEWRWVHIGKVRKPKDDRWLKLT
jgi:hypothetical protein